MMKQRCPANMSNASEPIVPKRIGKSVTFSEECDILKKDIENAVVFPKTKAPEKIAQAVSQKAPTFPQVEEVIELPYRESDEMREVDGDCMPSSSCKRIHRHRLFLTEASRKKMFKNHAHERKQMDVISNKLKRIYELKLMDDLTTLCKEKMSISKKETEKMDEDY